MPDPKVLLDEADKAIQSNNFSHALRVITTVSQDDDLAPEEAKHLFQTAVGYSTARAHQSSLTLHFVRCATCQVLALTFSLMPTKLGKRIAISLGKQVDC